MSIVLRNCIRRNIYSSGSKRTLLFKRGGELAGNNFAFRGLISTSKNPIFYVHCSLGGR
jgi:hypothetical protein